MIYDDPAVTYDHPDVVYNGPAVVPGWWVEVWDTANSTPLIRPLPDVVDVSFEVVPNDVGRGSITLAADHPDLADICDPRSSVQTLVKVWLHETFQWGFLADTVEDVYADDGARQVRVAGPGVEAVLGWGRVLWSDYPTEPTTGRAPVYGSPVELLEWGSFDGTNNLLANGGFEDATTDPWQGQVDGVDNTVVHSGGWALKATLTDVGGSISAQGGVTVGDNWTVFVDLWLRADRAGTITLLIRRSDGTFIVNDGVAVGPSWTPASATFVTQPGWSPILLTLINADGLGPMTLWVDDVSVIGEPPQLDKHDTTVRLTRFQATSGTTAAELSFAAGGDSSFVGVQYTFPVSPGQHYVHSVNVAGNTTDVVRLRLELDQTVEVLEELSGLNEWHTILVEGDAGPGQTTGRASLSSTMPGQVVVVADDFSIRPGFPAASAGKIVSDVVSAMQARGTLTFLTLGFDATEDSAGNPWPETLSMELDPSWSLLDLLAKLVGFGYEWTIDLTSGVRLDLYGPLGAGVDWTGATGAPTILPPVESADAQALVPATTVVFVEGADGVWTVQESGVPDLGRRELLVVNTAAQSGQETGLVAAQALNQAEAAGKAFTVRLTDAGDPMPFLDFHPMDTVRVHLPRGGPGVDYRAAMLATNPVAYWRLGETTGLTAVDSSGNGHDGTYVNGPTLGVPGLIVDPDTAASFDGVDDRVDLPVAAELLLPADMSAQAWIHPLSLTGGPRILIQQAVDGRYFDFSINAAGGLQVSWQDADGFKTVGTPSGTIVVGNTYHVAVTRDASLLIRLYVNGVEVGSGPGTPTVGTVNQFTLGAFAAGVAMFPGTIDEVAVHNYALTPAQVAALYARGVEGASVGEPDEIPDGWYRARAVAFAGTRESMRFDVDFGRYRTLRRDAESLLLSRLLDRQASDTWTPGEGSVAS